MPEMTRKSTELQVDPEAFDLVLQALIAISSISTLAASWMQIRSVRDSHRTVQNQENLRQQIRSLERSFDDLFEELRRALRILEPAFERQHGRSLREQPFRFGARVELTSQEFSELQSVLHQITSNFSQVRNITTSIQQTIQHTVHPSEENITDNLENFNGLMNALLFESRSFDEALERLDQLRIRSEDFLRRLRSFSN